MLNKKTPSSTNQDDPLVSIATAVWYGIGMAGAALLLGVPYLLLWDNLPAAIKFWLDPWSFLIVILIVGSAFTLLIKNLLDR